MLQKNVQALSQKSLMLFQILAALFVSTVSATALPSHAMVLFPRNDPFDTRNATFCWKSSYFRGFGELPDYQNENESTCPNTLEKSWGMCYPSCGEFGKGRGPVCWAKCSKGSDFPHPCGAGCAKDVQSCILNTINQIKETFEVAYNFGAVITAAAVFQGAAESDVLLDTGGVLMGWTYIGEQIAEAVESVFKQAIKHILSKYFDEKEAEGLTDEVTSAVFKNEPVAWTDYDPSGVLGLVEAFYRPMCK
jgi:hypothetical protein